MADGGPRRSALPNPEQRAALVGEISGLIDGAETLSADEASVLRHVLENAGLDLDGFLRIPAFAVLWGGVADSYFPAAPLPADRARSAAAILQRRGVLRAAAESDRSGVVLDAGVLRSLAG